MSIDRSPLRLFTTIGSIGDFFASFIYVPSEVLKTRMQLQGRYNNPSFISGYNYKNTWHALQMIVKYDGVGALYQGYRATLMRDVPFSAFQFAFYEKFKVEARKWEARPDGQMSLWVETACGGVAGGLAGFLTTPLDVMKTLLQTQVKKPTSVCIPICVYFGRVLPLTPTWQSNLDSRYFLLSL